MNLKALIKLLKNQDQDKALNFGFGGVLVHPKHSDQVMFTIQKDISIGEMLAVAKRAKKDTTVFSEVGKQSRVWARGNNGLPLSIGPTFMKLMINGGLATNPEQNATESGANAPFNGPGPGHYLR